MMKLLNFFAAIRPTDKVFNVILTGDYADSVRDIIGDDEQDCRTRFSESEFIGVKRGVLTEMALLPV